MFKLEGVWPNSKSKMTKALVAEVFRIVESVFGGALDRLVIITNDPNSAGPIAFYDKRDECYDLRLSVSSAGDWCKIAYQLAHELCHLYSNYSDSRGHKHKWFEESVCELCSLVVLRRLHKGWNKSSLFKYNKVFAPHILEYVEGIVAGRGVVPESRDAFLSWLSVNKSALEASSENRQLNGVVAIYLYSQVFSKEPSVWLCIRYLNKWDCLSNFDFADFLGGWKLACPKELRLERITSFLE